MEVCTSPLLLKNSLTFLRNIGILTGYVVFFFFTYLITAEFAKPPKGEGEVLVFRRGKMPGGLDDKARSDEEHQVRDIAVTEKLTSSSIEKAVPEQRPRPSACGKPIFHWEDICYDVKIKGQDRRILDHVDGWVQPGVITALMVSFLGSRMLHSHDLTRHRARPVPARPPSSTLWQHA